MAGATTSVLSWALIPALPLGGYVAARLGGPGAAIVGCCAAAALGIALLPWVGLPVVALALLGLLFGPPASLIMSLPASVLAPAERALGMGVYYTVYYAGMAGLPVLAGWARDRSGASAAPLYVAAALMALAGAGLPVFRALRRRAERG